PINIASSAAGGDVCAEPFPPFLFVCVFWRREKMSARTHPVSRQRSPDDQENSGISGAGAWLDAHYDPVASLYTFSSCMALEDLNRDGDHKFLVGDLGSGHSDMKLKVYKGTELSFETPLLDLPTGVATFYMDTTDPRTPAVAVAAGSFVYVYKNLRPYFKFTLPHLQRGEQGGTTECEITQVPAIGGRRGAASLVPGHLQTHSPPEKECHHRPWASLKKRHTEDDAVSCLVVPLRMENLRSRSRSFTVLKQFLLPSPQYSSVTGLHDVDYHISAACRDTASTPSRVWASYSVKGRRQWSLRLPASLTCMELLHHRPRSFKAVVVALQNREVRIYKDKFLVNCITVDDVVVGLKFGPFGREDGVLLMVTQGGALLVKISRDRSSFEAKDLTLVHRQLSWINSTSSQREPGDAQCVPAGPVQTETPDHTAYAKAVTSRLTPLTASPDCSLKIAAQVQGLGPIFRLTVTVQNTSPSKPVTNCYITFRCDEGLYRITRKFIQMPLLVPTVSYNFDTMVQCTDDMGRAEEISVYVVQNHTSTPLITAVLNMPVSETIIVT
ncbi:Bardet-Biedl syndrome 1 protein homolog, partial [Geodia barretti]